MYQQWSTLKSFEGHYPTIGSWVINGQAAGIGIWEEESFILTDQRRFIPHCFS
ncbi:glutathionylspermidine synthase family protein [Candidatus Odyssella thessalonicensis]|uniref:glutathionylspermidine synthase family protein n=1 Tax=Candidatus Odyssella thessalonicensis TaxID=84647 RepID=UPI000A067D8B